MSWPVVTNPIPSDLLEWIDRDSQSSSRIPPKRREAFRFLADRAVELQARFGGQFVAAADGEVKAHGENWVQVYLELKRLGIPWDVAAVRYFSKPGELAELLGCW